MVPRPSGQLQPLGTTTVFVTLRVVPRWLYVWFLGSRGADGGTLAFGGLAIARNSQGLLHVRVSIWSLQLQRPFPPARILFRTHSLLGPSRQATAYF